MYSVFIYQRTI